MLKIKKRRILVLAAVLAVIACLGAGSVFAGSTAYTIEYSSNNIHSVKMEDGSEIVLFCMNNQRHWPHTTPAISSVPQYEETSIQEFCRENGLTDSAAISAFTDRLKTILYAGYPYNGMSLYQLKSGVTAVSEEQFDEILNPPQSIRDDFSDTIGSRTFSLDDFRNQTENMNALREFTQQVYELYLTGGTTKSGMTYSDITATPFYGAVWCMFNSSDPLTAYSAIYQTGYFLTEEQAYSATSNAVWNLMKEYGIPDNSGVQDSTALSKSLKVAQSTGVLTEKPSASNVSIEGDAVFRQNKSDGKWYTGTLNLKAPSTYQEVFSLSLPSGISAADGSSDVKPGDSFVLVSDEKPADGVSISLSASIPWMEGDLLVFQAIGDDSHEFQNMVGARIHTENITVSKSLSTEKKTTSVSFTKKWEDEDNKDGGRPTAEAFSSSLHLMNGDTEVAGAVPVITDNGDNTYTIVYKDLPLEDADGNEISYTLKEDEVSGYTADSSTAENGGTIVNTEKKENPDNPGKPDKPDNPSGSKDSTGSAGSTDSSKGSSNQAASDKDGSRPAETKTGSNAVNTGDAADVTLYGAAGIGAAALMTVLALVRRKKNSGVK